MGRRLEAVMMQMSDSTGLGMDIEGCETASWEARHELFGGFGVVVRDWACDLVRGWEGEGDALQRIVRLDW
jgi:hypothetical protein